MSDTGKMFSLTAPAPAQAHRCFEEVAKLVSAHLPTADVEHVGSTAVPGCLGKGDVDVVVLVEATGFEDARTVLDGLLVRSTRNDPTDGYVEYDYARGDHVATVHLVGRGGTHDLFHGFKALLLADPALIEQYNLLKLTWDGRSMDDYRAAKSAFVESLLDGASP